MAKVGGDLAHAGFQRSIIARTERWQSPLFSIYILNLTSQFQVQLDGWIGCRPSCQTRVGFRCNTIRPKLRTLVRMQLARVWVRCNLLRVSYSYMLFHRRFCMPAIDFYIARLSMAQWVRPVTYHDSGPISCPLPHQKAKRKVSQAWPKIAFGWYGSSRYPASSSNSFTSLMAHASSSLWMSLLLNPMIGMQPLLRSHASAIWLILRPFLSPISCSRLTMVLSASVNPPFICILSFVLADSSPGGFESNP